MTLVRLTQTTALVAVLSACEARADKLTIQEDEGERTIEGNVLTSDSAGNLLFESRDARHWVVTKDKIVKHEKSATPTPLWKAPELKAALAKEYGKDFKVTETGHYMIVHSCSVDTAREAGKLLNRAQGQFFFFFERKSGFKLQKPKQPLIAVVFEDRRQYQEHVSKFIGRTAEMTLGVFIPSVNRIYLYNAFGGDEGRRVEMASKVNSQFARQMSGHMLEQNISTLIHEAIHQVAYNTGFHNRKLVELPLWLVEGMAMYFETTDVNAKHGWKGGKTINPGRAELFRASYRNYERGFIEDLLVRDDRLRDPATASEGYALAWTFTYYLLKHHQKEYMDFVKLINARKEFSSYSRSARLADFEKAFKKSPSEMEDEFLEGVKKLLDGK